MEEGRRSRAIAFIAVMLGVPAACSQPRRPLDAGPVPDIPFELLLESGFEATVVTEPRLEAGLWAQDLTGEGWDTLPVRDGQSNQITYLVAASPLDRYATTLIETVPGQSGADTQALRMELREEDPSSSEGSRVQWGIYPPADFRQGYMRYWVFLQPDLASAAIPPGTNLARQMMEWKETGEPRADFRWQVLIRRETGAPTLTWFARAQYGDLQDSPDAWRCDSEVEVPIGRWALIEVFWLTHAVEGRFAFAVDGQIIFDYRGQTRRDSDLFVWWPLKVYAGTALPEFAVPLWQWVDDVVIATDVLPASPPWVGEPAPCETF